ncbi:hypothetical protein B0H10DRAFT_2234161 [Mycena sp. CBHHK59/15]|nr:hypothetical protein B0H10DRAFT_2234161 [Mycena sp. CBHHK59/15]
MFPLSLSLRKNPCFLCTSEHRFSTALNYSSLELYNDNIAKIVALALKKYRDNLCAEQHLLGNYLEHPQTLFLPSSLRTTLLDRLLSTDSRAAFDTLVSSWRHREDHSTTLYTLVAELRGDINQEREEARIARNAAQRDKRRAKRKLEDDESEEEEELEESDSSLPAEVLTPPPGKWHR